MLLELKNIHIHYNSVQALRGIDFSLQEGEFTALMGANGAGKSTLLKAIFGLVKIDEGEVYWKGKRIIPEPERIVRQGISYVPQGRQIFTSLSVLENLEMGGYQLKSGKILKHRIAQIFETFPTLAEKRKTIAGILSGGQQQLLALARGLVMQPKVLLLDEPTLGLSPKMVKEILQHIQKIHQQYEMTILTVEHNIKSLCAIVDRICVLDQGLMIADGTSAQLQKQALWNKIFLGRKTAQLS